MRTQRLLRVEAQPGALALEWDDGHTGLLHYIWLRDNCPCPECRHPSGQRLLNTFTIPPDVRPGRVSLGPDGQMEVHWLGEGHVSRYDPAWLRAYAMEDGPPPMPRALWDAGTFSGGLPEADYPTLLAQPAALRDWLRAIVTYGFALLHGVPTEPGMVTEVVGLFGYVRETNYGRLFDVRSVVNPNNLAYTGLALGAHTDNPYRDPTPTVQLLHCLASSASGGDSTLVDGFAVAEALRQAAPEKFGLLAHQPVRYRFADADAALESEFTVIGTDSGGRVNAVRLNNRSLAPLRLPPELVVPFYAAYRAFATLLEDPEYRIEFKLDAGDLFIVDNLRVLHGRTGFSGEGQRHLQGCYADMDGVRSKLAVLERDNP